MTTLQSSGRGAAREVAERALTRVRSEHTAGHRAVQLEGHVLELQGRVPRLEESGRADQAEMARAV